MYKIVINRENCAEIAKVIERCAASKEKIYPELGDIGERVKSNK